MYWSDSMNQRLRDGWTDGLSAREIGKTIPEFRQYPNHGKNAVVGQVAKIRNRALMAEDVVEAAFWTRGRRPSSNAATSPSTAKEKQYSPGVHPLRPKVRTPATNHPWISASTHRARHAMKAKKPDRVSRVDGSAIEITPPTDEEIYASYAAQIGKAANSTLL